MLYYYLAESLSELGMLTYLINKMEVIHVPLPQLTDERFIPDEIHRIKVRASIDILIFGVHSGIYLNNNITEINHLILRLLEILIKLPERALMNETERYQYKHGMYLKEELKMLSAFFYKLNETITN
jgi:hypothetical protein